MVIILQIPDHQYLKSNKKKKTVQSNEFNLYEETIEQLKIIKEAVRTVAENTSQIAVCGKCWKLGRINKRNKQYVKITCGKTYVLLISHLPISEAISLIL